MSKGEEEQEDSGLSPRCFKRFRVGIQATQRVSRRLNGYPGDSTGIQVTQEEGYRFVSMGKAESAKEYREDSALDLKVLDLYPNGFDVWDVLQDIRGKGQHLPVLIRNTTLDKPQ